MNDAAIAVCHLTKSFPGRGALESFFARRSQRGLVAAGRSLLSAGSAAAAAAHHARAHRHAHGDSRGRSALSSRAANWGLGTVRRPRPAAQPVAVSSRDALDPHLRLPRPLLGCDTWRQRQQGSRRSAIKSKKSVSFKRLIRWKFLFRILLCRLEKLRWCAILTD